MRRSAEMTLRGDYDVLSEIYDKVKSYAVKAKVIEDMLPIIIYEDTEGFAILMEEIKKNNLNYTFAEGREYTKEEIEAAEYFTMEIIYPWERDGITADDFGTKYEDSYSCSACKGGKKQVSDLIINKKKMGKYDIATIQPEIIVNERLYNLILENNLLGCQFRPVKDYKGKDELVLYQLVITNILPPMCDKIRLLIEKGVYCKECKRNGVFLRSEAIYNRESLKGAQDFNLTNEYFGMNLYCQRFVIVSSKVYKLFNKNKIKRVAFEPVRIIE